jgi:hypothetical protein
MQKFEGQIIRKFDSVDNGNAFNGVAVSVRTSGGSQAQIYATNDLNGSLLNNPLTSDDQGRYSFYAPNGRYTLSFNNGATSREIMMFDAEEFVGGSQTFVDPKSYGVVYGSGLTEAQRIANTIAFNECSAENNAIVFTGRMETYGRLRIYSGQCWKGISTIVSQIVNYHPTEQTIWDGTADLPISGENSTTEWKIARLNLISSGTGDVISATPFGCVIENNQFTCRNSAAIRYEGKALMVENLIRGNYFFECLKSLADQPVMGRNPTDQWIEDNRFWGGGNPSAPIMDTCVELADCSGSTLRGNHPYGFAQREFFRIGGLNVSVIDNFFEYMKNSLIYLIHGNPASFTVIGNKFWSQPVGSGGGDGTTVDYRGEPTALISVIFNEYNPCHSTYSGNIFMGGLNNVPIFNIRAGISNSTDNIILNFDKSNVVQGSYKLATKNGTATHSKMISTDHPRFRLWSGERTPNLFTLDFSEYFYTNNDFAESFPTPLPSHTGWLSYKEIKINNMSTVNTLKFSANPPATFAGSGTDRVWLEAGQSGRIVRENDTTYRLIKSGGGSGASEGVIDLSYSNVGNEQPATASLNPRKLIVDGDYAYSVNAGTLSLTEQGTVSIFDIANPDGCKALEQLNVGAVGALPTTLNVYGNYLYVQTVAGTLYIYDIREKAGVEDPSRLKRTMSLVAGNRHHSVIHGSYLIIPKTTGASAVDIYSLENPELPTLVTSYTGVTGTFRTCFINNTDLWMLNYSTTTTNNLKCISLADMKNPELMSQTTVASVRYCVDGTVQNNYLYVGGAHPDDKLTILDISRNDAVSNKFTSLTDQGRYVTANGKYLVTETDTYTLDNLIVPIQVISNPINFSQHKFVGNLMYTFANGAGAQGPNGADTNYGGTLRCYILNSNESTGARFGSVNVRKLFGDDVVVRDSFAANTANVGSGGVASLGNITTSQQVNAERGLSNTVYNKTATKRVYGAISTATDLFKVYGGDMQCFVKIKYALVNDHTLAASAAHTYGEKVLSFYISAAGAVTNRIVITDSLAAVSVGTASVPTFTLVSGDGGNTPVTIRVTCPQLSNANSESVFEAQVLTGLPKRSLEPA